MIIVTGGAGYIGSHVVDLLAREGETVMIVDNLSTGNRFAVEVLRKKYPGLVLFSQCDVLDYERFADVVEQTEPDAILHLAGVAIVQESMAYPLLYFDENFRMGLNVCQAAVEFKISHIVFASTCNIYGEDDYPASPYGESKLMVERMIEWMWRLYGIAGICLRFFNAAGAHREGHLGEYHRDESHLIPKAIQAALTGTSLPLYTVGEKFPVRDFVHVEDLAEAFVRALGLTGFQVLDVSTGQGTSTDRIVRLVEQATELPLTVDLQPARRGDPPYLVGSPYRLEQAMGWKPELPVEVSVRSAASWQYKLRTSGLA